MNQYAINTWGLNKLFNDDFDGTLSFLKSQGITLIEPTLYFSGNVNALRRTYNRLYLISSKQLNTNLDENIFELMLERYLNAGFKVESIHLSFFDELNLNGIAEKLIKIYRKYNIGYFVFSTMKAVSPNRLNQIIKLNDQLKAAGCELIFHNHSKELKNKEFIKKIAENFRLEVDVGWLQVSEYHFDEFIEQYKNRVVIWHLKDFTPDGKFCAYGKGVVPHEKTFNLNSEKKLLTVLDIDYAEDMHETIRESMKFICRE